MTEMAFAIGKAKASVPGEGCGFILNPKLKLLDQVSEVMRFKHHVMAKPGLGVRSPLDN